MAEATDRPQTSGQTPSDAVMPGEQFNPLTPPAAETYRALSLLAMAGFGIAALYAVIVVIGAAVALFSRIPWLMSYWTFLIPVAALVVCGAARTRIRDSEGTLSGLAFATWGSRLAILVGVLYVAYYASTFLVVRYQAIQCADKFFAQLKQGNSELAFLMSKGNPPAGLDKSELRDEVESRFNQPRGRVGAVGPFTRFREDLFVRFIEMDGEQTKVYPRGVAEWEYSNGGYKVVLNYHVATSLIEFDARVDTFGRDPKPGEPKGRQWQIMLAGGAVTTVQDSIRRTPEGEEITLKSLMGQNFVSQWIGKVNQGDWKEAYLDTLKSSERPAANKVRSSILQPEKKLAKLIQLDDKTFWANQKQRQDIMPRARGTFQLGSNGRPTFSMSLQQQAVPFFRTTDGVLTESFDVSLFYLDESAGVMKYMVEGRLVVSAPTDEAVTKASAWRVEALHLDSGRSPPDQPMQRAPPPPQTGRDGRAIPR